MSTPETSEDSFGFGSVDSSIKDRIKQIRPTVPAVIPTDLTKIDAVADGAGFVSREAGGLPYLYQSNRAPKAAEPRVAINMRAPLTLASQFQKFCEENRYSYPEGLGEIMKRAGI